MAKHGLGRGLAALIPDAKGVARTGITQIPVSDIVPNPYQPRKKFDPESFNEFLSTVKEKGIIQPILVRTKEGKGYELIAGERRLRAAKTLGLGTIPAIIKEATKSELLELALIENIHRADLTALEEANAYKQLVEEHNLTQDEVAKRVGKKRVTITNFLRILKLPEEIQKHLASGAITMGHAILILSLTNEIEQKRMCTKIANEGLSVRATEQLINSLIRTTPRKKHAIKSFTKDVHMLAAEDKLRKKLGTKVSIISNGNSGRIEIEYYSISDLERIIEIIDK